MSTKKTGVTTGNLISVVSQVHDYIFGLLISGPLSPKYFTLTCQPTGSVYIFPCYAVFLTHGQFSGTSRVRGHISSICSNAIWTYSAHVYTNWNNSVICPIQVLSRLQKQYEPLSFLLAGITSWWGRSGGQRESILHAQNMMFLMHDDRAFRMHVFHLYSTCMCTSW